MMDSTAEAVKTKENVQKRSPLDLIMNQLRRKRSMTERKKASVGRFFRPAEASDRKPGESDSSLRKENSQLGKDSSATDAEQALGWGRVKQFLQKLGKTPHSQSLNLSHCDLTATDVVELATLLPYMARLEVMDLSWNDLVGGSLMALTVHLQLVAKIRVLKLRSCRLTGEDLAALGEALHCLLEMEELDLSWNIGVGAGNFRFFTKSLHPEATMKDLRLVDCRLSEADVTALSEALSVLRCLEELDLSCNQLSLNGMEKLTSSFGSTRLKILKLSTCGLCRDGLRVLGLAFSLVPALEQLDLSCNQDVSGGLVSLDTHVCYLTHLHTLDFHRCRLTEEDLLALARACSSLKELRELDLSSNKSVGATLPSFLQTLPVSQLTWLPLNNCALSSSTCRALASAVPSLSQLQSLNLSWNKSVRHNLQSLLEPLQSNSCLQELRLSSCGLTTEDILQIEAAAQRGALNRLKLLDLSYNAEVRDGAWTSLFGKALCLKALEELDISLRPSSSLCASPWFPSFLEALPLLSSLRRLSLQSWNISAAQRQALEKLLQQRNIVLECDGPTTH